METMELDLTTDTARESTRLNKAHTTARKGKTLTDEQKAKIQAAAEERKAERQQAKDKPMLVVGKWSIVRLDDDCIVLTDDVNNSAKYLYYGKFTDAVKGLYIRLSEGKMRSGVENIVKAYQDGMTEVTKALAKL